MDMQDEKYQAHIKLDRVRDIDGVRDFVECCLCHGLAWYPVACENCGKSFCSACIRAFHKDQLERNCPHGCSPYVERQDPRVIIRLLADLKVNCQYKSNGCPEVVSYTELERHEQMCDYQLLSCNGCEQKIIKKTFQEHLNECPLIPLKCDQCLTSYRREAKDLHTSTECLLVQFQQQKSRIEQLERIVVKQQTKIDRMEQLIHGSKKYWAQFCLSIEEAK